MAITIVLSACQSREQTTITTTSTETQRPAVQDAQVVAIRDFADRLQTSQNRFDEADTLKRLHRYLADHDLTFTTQGSRADDNTTITGNLSGSNIPLRVRVDVFRGQQPLNSFTFVPRDNRNLALLGQ
jgi:hypothetical protein